jgi:hypothetical protein
VLIIEITVIRRGWSLERPDDVLTDLGGVSYRSCLEQSMEVEGEPGIETIKLGSGLQQSSRPVNVEYPVSGGESGEW